MTRNPALPDPIRSILNSATPHVPDTPSRKSRINAGDRFNRFVVLGRAEGPANWIVRCDCGTEKAVSSSHLLGKTKSCGCLRGINHGKSRSSEYRTWKSIKRRCYNRATKDYPDYGGRGITVCDRWISSFPNFFEDMGPRPTPNLSIERRENSKGYSPDNCYWATITEQQSNKRRNQHVFLAGEKITVAEASRRLGLKPNRISDYVKYKKATRQEAVDHYLSLGAS